MDNLCRQMPNKIRWNSPLFETPLHCTPQPEEVRFPRQHPRPMGDFRIRTIFGDILHGPIHASDRDGLVIKHGRLGEVFVAYPHLYSVAHDVSNGACRWRSF